MKIIFTLEEIDTDDVGISVQVDEGVAEDSKIMHVAAAMYGSLVIDHSINDHLNTGTIQ